MRAPLICLIATALMSSCVDYDDWPVKESQPRENTSTSTTGHSSGDNSTLLPDSSSSLGSSSSEVPNPDSSKEGAPEPDTTQPNDTVPEPDTTKPNDTVPEPGTTTTENPEATQTTEESTGSSTTQTTDSDSSFNCEEVDDGNNSEMSAKHIGTLRTGQEKVGSGVVQSPSSPCDDTDFFSFDLTGSVAKIEIGLKTRGFGSVRMEISKVESDDVLTFTSEVGNDIVATHTLPNGRYIVKIVQVHGPDSDIARYDLSVRHREGSSVTETVDPGSSWNTAIQMGDLEEMLYASPKHQGYVGTFDASDYYVFTNNSGLETGFFGVHADLGSPKVTIGRIEDITSGKPKIVEIESFDAKANVLNEIKTPFDSAWLYYVIIVTAETDKGLGTDYKLYAGPKWFKPSTTFWFNEPRGTSPN